MYEKEGSTPMKKVAIYTKVSRHGDPDLALAAQEKEVRKYCADKGYTVCDAARVIGSSREGFPVLLDMLNRAKETGIEAVVMKTTRGVACSISEMVPVKKAFDDAVVAIEAMDESHQAFNDDILLTFSMVAQTDMANTENEKICGYDETENGLIINEEEAAVVRYIFEKNTEYADNPPAALVQEIIDEYASRGESITPEDAAAKVRFDSIDAVIEEDVKERWPDVYESMCEKMAYNHFSYMQKALRAAAPAIRHLEHTPIISKETWEAAQEKKEHAPEQHGHGMKFK
jgi:hypothetical protein